MVASPKSPKSPQKGATGASPKSTVTAQSPSQAGSPPNPNPNPVTEIGAGELIEADENVDEGFDMDDHASSSASITSSILKYRQENGRTYHAYKDGAYVYPNDEVEQDRLDLQHYMCIRTFNDRLFLNPMEPEKMRRVLDCGTGTGCWAIDFGDEFPHAEVWGVDLSPIQPQFTPPNVQFFVDDLEDEWTYSQPFDFIYLRMLAGSLADWPKLFKQAYDNLAPGGYIELCDPCLPLVSDDKTLPENCALSQWANYVIEASVALGRPFNSAEMYSDLMEQTGFVKVVEKRFGWPTNKWPREPIYKELGIGMYENIGRNLSGVTVAPFTRGLGWSREQCEVFLVNVRRDFKNPNIHAYCPLVVVYGQKPLV